MTQIGEPVESLAAQIGPDPLIGMVIDGKYEIVRLLGQGGMGSVYEGVHRLIGKRVAIKVLHPEFTMSADIVERFQREARAATSIGHPNIIDVTDMGRMPRGGFFQVLELLDGKSFGDVLDASGPLSIARVVKIFSQVADALAAAHDKGIVHRDLKPDNIFLVRRNDEEDFVKLLDFGVAKFLDANETPSGGPRSGPATRTGMAIGTPQYMSPEQAQGLKSIDKRSDIFALGVMAYEALAGVRPFEAESFAIVIFQLCTAEAAPLKRYRSDLPPELVAVVERMLAKRPEDRYADCRAVKAALAPFASLDAAPVTTSAPTEPALDLGSRVMSDEATGATRLAVPAMATPPASATPPAAPISSTSTPRSTESLAPRAPATQGRAQLVAIGALAVAVVALGAVVASNQARDASASEVSAPPSAVAAPASVHVSIHTEPSGATLTLDGVTVAAPYSAERPRDDAPHVVRATLDGYAPVEQSILFAVDVDVALRLSPIAPAEAGDVATPAPIDVVPSSTHHGHPRATPVTSETAPTVTAATPPSEPPSEAPTHAPPLKRVVF